MKLGLGTAQLGLDYGIANVMGKPTPSEVKEILALASQSGVGVLDTATAYGSSEEIIGRSLPADHDFDIVTKTPSFGNETIGRAETVELRKSFAKSLERLVQPSVYGLLAHNAEDLLAKNGAWLYEAMCELKHQGMVEKIGVSVYDSEDIDRIADVYAIDLIQVPVNVLDQRLIMDRHLHQLQESGIEIHARSVFLQGLLLMPPRKTPAYFDPIRPLLERYHSAVLSAGLSALEAAISFVKSIDQVNCLLVGAESRSHVVEIARAFNTIPAHAMDFTPFALDNQSFLNPALWRTSA
jgi:aryl-alcohol dehydrogenase-like predicted oxidoreductase